MHFMMPKYTKYVGVSEKLAISMPNPHTFAKHSAHDILAPVEKSQ